jgi:putative transport protein
VGAIVIMIVPLIVGMAVGSRILRMPPLQMLGGICGAMTSTPGLGALMSKIDSNVPVTSYATIYPLALILMTITAPALVWLLSR